tara:strand:- start:164 stop:1888 length:1725 start_codon:yes stop_codon:yes gene_type:complete
MAETMALIVANGKENRVANKAKNNAGGIIDVTPSNGGGAKENPMAEFISGFASSMNSIVESLNKQNQSLAQIKNILREQLNFDKDQARAEGDAAAALKLDKQGADAASSGGGGMIKALPDLKMGNSFWSALLLGLGGLALQFVGALSEWWRTFKVMPFLTRLIGKPILGLITMVSKPFIKLMETIKKSTKFQKAVLRIKDAIAALQSFIRALIPDKLVETLKNLKGRAMRSLAPKITKMMEFFEEIGNKLGKIKGLAGTGFVKKIFSKLPFINVLFAAFEAITGFIEGFKEGGVLEGIQRGIKNLISFFVDDVLGIVKTVAVWITDKLGFTGISEAIDNWELPKFSEIFETITDALGGFFGFAESDEEKQKADEAQNKIKGFFTNLWDTIVGRIKKILDPRNWFDGDFSLGLTGNGQGRNAPPGALDMPVPENPDAPWYSNIFGGGDDDNSVELEKTNASIQRLESEYSSLDQKSQDPRVAKRSRDIRSILHNLHDKRKKLRAPMVKEMQGQADYLDPTNEYLKPTESNMPASVSQVNDNSQQVTSSDQVTVIASSDTGVNRGYAAGSVEFQDF